MLKFTNKNFINNINKLYLKDKSLILYIILATLLFIENTIFFFDKEYKYNIFTILSLFTIYLYFNSIKIAIITAILIINIYYLLYKNIYESFDEYAANTGCANLTGAIENVYNEKADEKYYEYCQLSGLKDSVKQSGNLLGPLGGAYPYDITGKVLKHPSDEKFDYRHDLSFRQWMIYNYESLYNDISDNGSFKRDYLHANGVVNNNAPRGTAIISITDAYIKNLQQREVNNCTTPYASTDINKETLKNAWNGYDISGNTDTKVIDSN